MNTVNDDPFEMFMSCEPRVIDPQISKLYDGALGNVPGAGLRYALRFLSVARRGDVLRIHTSLQDIITSAIEHHERAGVETVLPEDIIWSDVFADQFNSKYQGRSALFFMFDQEAHEVRPDQERLKATLNLENKADFTERWLPSGMLPPSSVVRRTARANPLQIWSDIGCRPGIMKAAWTASGNLNVEFNSQEQLAKLVSSPEWQEVDYVVQQKVGSVDVSVNALIDMLGPQTLFATRQIMKDKCHEGNLQDERLVDLCHEKIKGMIRSAWESGVRDFIGFDLRYDPDTGRMWVIECNARFTGPIYGWLLAKRLGMPWFGVKNLKGLSFQKLDNVVSPQFQFRAGRERGVIIHNPGPLSAPKKEDRACGITIVAEDEVAGLDLLREIERHNGIRQVA